LIATAGKSQTDQEASDGKGGIHKICRKPYTLHAPYLLDFLKANSTSRLEIQPFTLIAKRLLVDPPPHNGDKVKGQVVAYFIEEKSDQVLVELPGEPVVGGLRAWVPRGDLAYAMTA